MTIEVFHYRTYDFIPALLKPARPWRRSHTNWRPRLGPRPPGKGVSLLSLVTRLLRVGHIQVAVGAQSYRPSSHTLWVRALRRLGYAPVISSRRIARLLWVFLYPA